MMVNRRSFIRHILAGAAYLSIPSPLKALNLQREFRLVLLHTNDLHSHIEPMPLNHGRFPGMGGLARLSSIVKQIRNQHEHILLLDSGDIFQGTPYFNFYEGKLELKLMSEIGYDASTLGNHEFDNGIESLPNVLSFANFPFISTNYDFSETALKGKTEPWYIFQKGPVRIGLIGLGIDPTGLIAPPNTEGLKYLDPIQTGNQMAMMLKNEKNCHLVIALSHLGFKMRGEKVDDQTVAANTSHIDMILGGHTHTFMDKPHVIRNLADKEVMIMQSGQNGVRLGRIDLIFRKGKQLIESESIAV